MWERVSYKCIHREDLEMGNYVQDLRKLVGHMPLQLPGTGVLVWRENNGKIEILLQLRSDHNKWGLLGGGIELGESYQLCAVRELHQESGLVTSEDKLKLLGVYAGPAHVSVHPNGDVVYHTVVLYALKYEDTALDTEAEISSETRKLGWLTLPEIRALLEDGEEATHFFPNNVPIIWDIVDKYFAGGFPQF